MSSSAIPARNPAASSYPTKPYTPRHTSWPYTPSDFTRPDTSSDETFYSFPRFVTHIDDNAISCLRKYYSETLPRKGQILDLCSSWISHFPPDLERIADPSNPNSDLKVIGLGMNTAELDKNSILSSRIVQDLNTNPTIPESIGPLEAVVCVVSIDYLIHPREVLESTKKLLKDNGGVHLIISNRCFPSKAINRWLRVSEEERLQMVGDYLHFAGFRDIEIVTLSDGGGGMMWNRVDPLWVVRGKKNGAMKID